MWLDAGRQEVFAARYRVDPSAAFGVTAMEDPMSARPAAVLEKWRATGEPMPVVWIGGGAMTYAADVKSSDSAIRILDTPLLAPLVAELGEQIAARMARSHRTRSGRSTFVVPTRSWPAADRWRSKAAHDAAGRG